MYRDVDLSWYMMQTYCDRSQQLKMQKRKVKKNLWRLLAFCLRELCKYIPTHSTIAEHISAFTVQQKSIYLIQNQKAAYCIEIEIACHTSIYLTSILELIQPPNLEMQCLAYKSSTDILHKQTTNCIYYYDAKIGQISVKSYNIVDRYITGPD